MSILCTIAIFYYYHPLREKCPNTEFFLVRIFLYSVGLNTHSLRIQENRNKKKLRIWTLFTQWSLMLLSLIALLITLWLLWLTFDFFFLVFTFSFYLFVIINIKHFLLLKSSLLLLHFTNDNINLFGHFEIH